MTSRFILFLAELRINDRAQWPSPRKSALQLYYYKIWGRTNFPSSPALAVGELCKGEKIVVQVIVNFTFGSCVLTTCEVGHLSHGTHCLQAAYSQAGKMVALCCSLVMVLEFTIWDEIPQLFMSFIRLHLKSSLPWKFDGKMAVKNFSYCSAIWFWEDRVEKEVFRSILMSSCLGVTVCVSGAYIKWPTVWHVVHFV